MMLAQFQSRYPTASLISELLTIHQGKFVVQVSVQIDGVTRATGLAAAEVLEEAEDKARSRAIALMAIDTAPPSATTIPQPPESAFVPPSVPSYQAPVESPDFEYEAIASSPPTNIPPVSLTPISVTKSKLSLSDRHLSDEQDIFGDFGQPEPKDSGSAIAMGSKVTPIRPIEPQLDLESEIETHSQPIDLSEDLITIKDKLEESGWKQDTEREYLQRTYGKSSRDELTPEQVQEFRRYLELFSQTTQITKELRELKWSNELGRRYLSQTYNRKLRQELSYQQLQEFLEFLKSERDRLRTK